jgi:hypothetical protein
MIFSDKNRIVIIFITTALILAGCFYGAWQGPRQDPSPEASLKNPGNIGQKTVIRYAKVLEVSGSEVLLRAVGYQFTATFAEPIEIAVGNDISLIGNIKSPTRLQISEYHIHPWRPLKYYISLPAIALVMYILFKKYRLNYRRFIFEEK